MNVTPRRETMDSEAAQRAFWAKVDRSAGPMACWRWTGARFPFGYGAFKVGGRPVGAHRIAWELTNGPIPDGLHVLHHCDNPPCCNPLHFFLGSLRDNSEDMARKGRGYNGERNHLAKLTEPVVRVIRYRAAAGEGALDLANAFGISESHAHRIISRRSWRHI